MISLFIGLSTDVCYCSLPSKRNYVVISYNSHNGVDGLHR